MAVWGEGTSTPRSLRHSIDEIPVVSQSTAGIMATRTGIVLDDDLKLCDNLAMICVIRRLALTVSDVCLKLGCFQSS